MVTGPVQALVISYFQAQTQMLLEKIVEASNPSVATASLGQALANEKK